MSYRLDESIFYRNLHGVFDARYVGRVKRKVWVEPIVNGVYTEHYKQIDLVATLKPHSQTQLSCQP
jgi:hypothetical protein